MPDGRLAVVIGIGVNVVAAPEGTPTPATSLAAHGVRHRRRGPVRRAVGCLGRVPRHLGQWPRLRRNPPAVAGARGYGLGQPVAVQAGARHGSRAIFDTIDEQGCLIVRKADGNRVADIGRRRLFRRRSVGGGGLMARPDELIFAPLGGVGEIGMNLSIYGFGPPRSGPGWWSISACPSATRSICRASI